MNALSTIAKRAPLLTHDYPQSSPMLLKNLMVGTLLDSLLFGVVAVQCVNYWQSWPNHSRVVSYTVGVLLFFNIWQTATNQIGIVQITERTAENLEWYNWAATTPVWFIGRFTGIFLMAIPHILLARKALNFAKSLEYWSRRWRIAFASALGLGIATAFLSGSAAFIALWLQANQWKGKAIPEGTLDWWAIMISINLTTSAVTDLILAGTLTWELKKSSSGDIGFGGTNKMLHSLTVILLTNGICLAVLQFTICGVHLSGGNNTVAVVGLYILHKIYTITALLSICRPLEMQRDANQNPVRGADFSNGENTQNSTLVSRISGLLWKKGKDTGITKSFEDDMEKGSKRSQATTSHTSTLPHLATLSKHEVTNPAAAAGPPSSSGAPLNPQRSNVPRANETYGLDMSYILSDMENEGVVALVEVQEKELAARMGSKRSD